MEALGAVNQTNERRGKENASHNAVTGGQMAELRQCVEALNQALRESKNRMATFND